MNATFATPPWVQNLMQGWEPRERIGGAAWAERERELSIEESSSPGRWRSIPWQVEILDALADQSLSWIVILKATQVGCSELVRCAIGRWALLDPGDVLWVMTTEQAARRAMKKLQAMFRATPALRSLLSDRRRDTTLLELVLTNGMRIVIGWAGSAQSLSSDPFRYVILDEVAKYTWNVQGEGAPVDLARDRTKTFGRRGKVILLSSPKSDDDAICTSYRETTDRRVFAAACPTCGKAQPFEWERTRWPGGDPDRSPADVTNRVALAERVEREQSAWLQCLTGGCAGKIEPTRAQWAPGARWVHEDTGAPPVERSRRRAYHVPEAWHWESTLSGIATKFLRATHPRSLQTFWSGTLGRVLRSAATTFGAELLEARARHPNGLVPSWATAVLATADTQADHFWLMLRAWGPGQRSRLLDWGRVGTFEELERRALRARFPVEGRGETVSARFLMIDSGGGMARPDGSRTGDVYKFAARVAHVIPAKGVGDQDVVDGKPIRASKITYTPPGAKESTDVDLHLLHAEWWKDSAAALIRADKPIVWEESQSAVAPEYGKQLAGEHKVMHTLPDGETYWRWCKRSKGGDEHLWDCAWMQVAAAELAHVDTDAPIVARVEAKAKRARSSSSKKREAKRARLPDGRPFHVGRR